MKLSHIIAAASLTVSGFAFAVEKAEQNCEVKGKKVTVKDEAACTKKKGTWLPVAAAPAAAKAETTTAPAAAPSEGSAVDSAAPAPAAVEAEPSK